MENLLHHNVAQGNGLANGSDGFHLEGLSSGAPEGNRFNQNDSENNGGDGFDMDANTNGNVYIKNDANGNIGAGMIDGSAGTANMYTDNDCAGNGIGIDSVPAGLCN